jgi:peptidoglycan/LPS O-acetylase OafA/YrhL
MGEAASIEANGRTDGGRLSRIADRRLSADASVALDLLRALAAILVMVGHVRGLFFVDFAQVAEKSLAVRAIYFATALGHEAVMVFFVLSGYFIAGNVLRALARSGWNWPWYLVRRITRLHIVLLPALLAGLALDHLGLSLFGTAGPYGAVEAYRAIVPVPVAERLDIPTFLGNAFYLQEILTPTLGSNGPLWSLSFEFWYYLAFPCLALAAVGRGGAGRRFAWLACAVAILAFTGPVIALYFVIWLAGVVVLALPGRAGKSVWRSRLDIVCAALLLLGMLALSVQGTHGRVLADFSVAFAVALLIAALAGMPDRSTGRGIAPRAAALARLGRWLAGFSYTLYLVHLPVLVFLQAWLVSMGGGRWQPDLPHLAAGAGIALAMIAYAAVFGAFTEARTETARRWLSAKLGVA